MAGDPLLFVVYRGGDRCEALLLFRLFGDGGVILLETLRLLRRTPPGCPSSMGG